MIYYAEYNPKYIWKQTIHSVFNETLLELVTKTTGMDWFLIIYYGLKNLGSIAQTNKLKEGGNQLILEIFNKMY